MTRRRLCPAKIVCCWVCGNIMTEAMPFDEKVRRHAQNTLRCDSCCGKLFVPKICGAPPTVLLVGRRRILCCSVFRNTLP